MLVGNCCRMGPEIDKEYRMSSIQGIGSTSWLKPAFADKNGKALTLQEVIDSGLVPPPRLVDDIFKEEAGHAPVYDEYGNFLHKPLTTSENWAATKSATSANGTYVVVGEQKSAGEPARYTLGLGTGTDRELSLDFTGDVRIGTAENGDYLVYSTEKHATTRYLADGTSFEIEGDATQAASEKIYVSTTGGEIYGGDGDEVFFIFGNNTRLHCGNGNDKVILGDLVEAATIHAGEGDNAITGGQLHASHITAGSGNNTIQLQKSLDTRLDLGGGNNVVKINEYIDGSASMGDGNNNLMLGSALGLDLTIGAGDNAVTISNKMNQESRLSLGDGDNTLKIGSLGLTVFGPLSRRLPDEIGFLSREELDTYFERPVIAGSSASISLGSGNNTVQVREMSYASSIDIGDGNNNVSVGSMKYDSSVSIGNGNNSIVSKGTLRHGASITCGDGTNMIEYEGAEQGAFLKVGNGANYRKNALTSHYARLASGTHTEKVNVVTQYIFPKESIEPQRMNSPANTELTDRVAMLWH